MALRIATCQFAVSDSIVHNARTILRQMTQAASKGAHIAHFPECALSGYAGFDIPSTDAIDFDLLDQQTQIIQDKAAQLNLWIALGTTHHIDDKTKPHNSLYLVDANGQCVDRYDKRFCMPGDFDHFTPGDHFVIFDLHGVRCTLLICFDVRFGELYRALHAQGVQCVLQSFYNARQSGPSIHNHIMIPTMQCRCASNYFWGTMSNSSAPYSPYPSTFISPDGKVVNQLRRNRPGVMVNTVDLTQTFYDPMADYRPLAVGGSSVMRE